MTDHAIIAALKKRQELEERIARTEQRIKAFKAQIIEINAFISQWEKFSGQAAPSLALRNPSQIDTDSAPAGNSTKEQVAAAAADILIHERAPLPRAELYKRLVEKGLRLSGKNPEMVLSTMLWRAGEDAGIVRLKTGGYWMEVFVRPEDKDGSEPSSGGIRRRMFPDG